MDHKLEPSLLSNKILFRKTVKILQVGLYICSIVSLFITIPAVSVRWAENCRNRIEYYCHNFSISGSIIAAPVSYIIIIITYCL